MTPYLKFSLKCFARVRNPFTVSRDRYVDEVKAVARWSEECGCKGILVYTDNSLVDPWLVSQIILQNTKKLCPLVAVQPAYMHPYAVAKIVSSFAHLYERRIFLNMVAGGFTTDLAALNDTTPHDKRYARLIEYTSIIQQLLGNSGPVTYEGEFYTIRNLKMTPPVACAVASRRVRIRLIRGRSFGCQGIGRDGCEIP